MIVCKICNKEFKSNLSLGVHLRFHNITAQEYYDKYLMKDNNEKICFRDRCNNIKPFKDTTVGYGSYCSKKCIHSGKKLTNEHKKKLSDNHADFRGKNSPHYGKSPSNEIKKKISQTLKQYFKNNPELMKKENHPCWGKKQTNKEKEKRINSRKDYYKKYPEKQLRGKNHQCYGRKRSKEEMDKAIKSVKEFYANLSDEERLKRRIRMSATAQKIPIDKWSGFKKNKRAQLKDTVEYKEWRTSIFERDGFKCIICGRNGKNALNSHHIYPVRDYPDMVFNMANGVTLCTKCHKKTHWKEYEYIDLFNSYIKEQGYAKAI